ncbi:N-acyl homoserine lactonase family protein [uncultured Microbacterium sp.]|jgi:glyoxylase-like metal-dependent hydrolase (beta-lactamase superfamily II)|uniref:N-acyl homoserine lactonase family protein n=1 Tax=uncultured Microbacterium sp. TaxID=191216 RepID=UPI0028D5841B|nr:N-acyl homoserine lactonase family protein [uncultured Microbacterium sp.]
MPDDQYEVVIARHGTRTGTRSEAFLNYALYDEPDAPFTTDYYVWIIRNDQRTIIVDTGYAAEAAARRGRVVLHSPAELLERIGVDPGAGHPVIITHAHWDHIGNLDLFPASQFWIARAESDFWALPTSRAPMISHFTEEPELQRLAELRARGRVTVFDAQVEIAPGITVMQVGGHTPGQSMITVRTSVGVALLTSDAVHFREELRDERPFVSVTDLPAMYQGFWTVKGMLASGAVDFIVTGHDPSALDDGELLEPDIAVIGKLRQTAPLYHRPGVPKRSR